MKDFKHISIQCPAVLLVKFHVSNRTLHVAPDSGILGIDPTEICMIVHSTFAFKGGESNQLIGRDIKFM